jgi:DNA-binding CsgD family transcriptional regulator
VALAVAVGQTERAARLAGALRALSEAVSVRTIPLVEAVLVPALEEIRRRLSDAEYAASQQLGRRMSRDEIIAEALAIDVEAPPARAAEVSTHAQATTLPAGGSPPDGLTAREVEVLGLIASGCTTQEIAERLVISVHTVERHITHVYQKIGARGRAEATAYALQHHLA